MLFIGKVLVASSVGTVSVATAITTIKLSDYYYHSKSAVSRATNQNSSTVDPYPLKIQTSQEQIEKDDKFDICQRENLSFKVKDETNGERWVLERDYQKSRDGEILDANYNFNKCDRQVSIPKLRP